jgi:hypothetical protein
MPLPGLSPGKQLRGTYSLQLCWLDGVKELAQHYVHDTSGRASSATITRSPNNSREIEYFSVSGRENVSGDC